MRDPARTALCGPRALRQVPGPARRRLDGRRRSRPGRAQPGRDTRRMAARLRADGGRAGQHRGATPDSLRVSKGLWSRRDGRRRPRAGRRVLVPQPRRRCSASRWTSGRRASRRRWWTLARVPRPPPGRCSTPKPQFGADVMSRIHAAGQDESGAAAAHGRGASRHRRPRGAAHREGRRDRTSRWWRPAVVGNPTMLHLWLGEDSWGLGVAPYEGRWIGSRQVLARDIGLPIAPGAPVYVLPCVKSHVGADAVGAAIGVDLDWTDAPALLIDLGTNSEIVLADGARVFAASTAAGPAFECGGISCGMRAAEGAIDALHLEPDGRLEPARDRGGAAARDVRLGSARCGRRTAARRRDRPQRLPARCRSGERARAGRPSPGRLGGTGAPRSVSIVAPAGGTPRHHAVRQPTSVSSSWPSVPCGPASRSCAPKPV